jgi:hypothetical protein
MKHRTGIEITSCRDTTILLDDVIERPQPKDLRIFDVKSSLDNATIHKTDYIKSDNKSPLAVTALVYSTQELNIAQLVLQSNTGLREIPMQVTPLPVSGLYLVSSTIQPQMLAAPGISYWIYAESAQISNISDKITIPVEQKQVNVLLELDIVKSVKEGRNANFAAYITNYDADVYGTVSLLVDGKPVSTTPATFSKGQTKVNLEWGVPRTQNTTSYDVSAKLEVYGNNIHTTTEKISSYPQSVAASIQQPLEITSITDGDGRIVAHATTLYASDTAADMRFKVVAPDGTCVIGSSSGCLIKGMTQNHRGVDVAIDGQIYRIRYSGETSILERFSIVSVDPIVGKWSIQMESDNDIIPRAFALDDVMVNIGYKGNNSMVVLRSN